MDDALLELVLERFDRAPLAEEPAALLLAACESEASLTSQLDGAALPDASAPGETVLAAAEPAGAYIRSITVTGFRGVGPPATLTVEPGPGLTVIVGRNGSGKSSFAEALEVLLTGDLKRWEDLSAVWREGWRNLHAPEPAEVTAEFLVEEAGPTTVRRTWAQGATFGESTATVQAAGQKQAGLDRLGWSDALVTYRPFLSHAELEAFLGKPSHLYDLLSSVLGLEDLTLAEERLTSARKERESGLTEVGKDLPGLRERLELADDERAQACLDALSGKSPDIERARVIATSAAAVPADTQIGRLRQLSQLVVPSREQVQEAVAALGEAADMLAKTAASEAGQAQALMGLLGAALDHYRAHGPGDCPVCGRSGALDEDWRVHTEDAMARLGVQAAAAKQATTAADDAKTQARNVFLPVPATLSGPSVGDADPAPGAGRMG